MDEIELQLLQTNPPPDPLPDGWIMHRSKSQHGYCYYFNQFTGECKWDPPYVAPKLSQLEGLKETLASLTELGATAAVSSINDVTDINNHDENATDEASSSVKSILKKVNESTNSSDTKTGFEGGDNDGNDNDDHSPSKKRHHHHHHHEKSSSGHNSKRIKSSSSKTTPDKVRTLHILKKHRGSRRPSSWRQASITITKEEAIAELRELINILQDVYASGDAKELRATFEELAKTESDCSSAKRGGDLGFFARNKMQPNFEKASFDLEINEMSDIVETSSGVHVILRLG